MANIITGATGGSGGGGTAGYGQNSDESGGAGGMISGGSFPVAVGQTVTIIIGAGGTGDTDDAIARLILTCRPTVTFVNRPANQ